MTEDRKAELARMCRLEIRKTSALSKSRMSEYGYHLVEAVVDAEIEVMLGRLADKSVRPGDVGILWELVVEDLWPRLREAHRKHRDDVYDAIKKMNRATITADATFAFDIGWRQLLQAAAERTQTYPAAWKARIAGGKEKLGCCVIHIDYDGSQRGARSEIERLREEVRLRSLATCDICGGQGRLRISSIAKTTCDKHAAVLGQIREDDGTWADPWEVKSVSTDKGA